MNLRGAALEDGRGDLVDAGVAEAHATSVVEVLKVCEDARFSPSGVSVDEARAAWQKGRAVIDALSSGASAS